MTFLKHKEKIILQNTLNSVEELAYLTTDNISQMVKRVLTTTVWQPQHIVRRVDEMTHIMRMYEIGTVHVDDADYPALLREIYDPPYMLFYRGSISALFEPCVSVVGTRHPTRAAAEAAHLFASDAVNEGFTVVSGLAYGRDSFAHKGAISAAQKKAALTGTTCAVLASGADIISPEGNKRLAHAMLSEGGCIVSEYTPGTPAAKWHFPERNRIISGLSPAVVVVDAPENSGALITADFALEQGRDVYFHEAALHRFVRGEQLDTDTLLVQQKTNRNALNYISEGAPVVSSFRDYIEQKELSANSVCRKTQLTLF
jgi:DNA processing protein